MKTDVVKIFVNKYNRGGPEKFYNSIVTNSVNNLAEPDIKYNPALELIEFYDMFLKLYRREGDPIYLEISILFRKAGHVLYKIMLQRKMMKKSNKFLNLV